MTSASLRRILVVDDDPDILALTEVALSDLGGLTVSLCESAADAVNRAREFSPDALLLDLYLPGIGGRGVLEKLRALPETRSLPVVLLTAQSDNSEIEPLAYLGLSGVIRKPFDPETLADELRRLCARA